MEFITGTHPTNIKSKSMSAHLNLELSVPPVSFLNGLTSFIKDARNFQILYLTSFLIFGLSFLNWDSDLPRYAITITTCLLIQAIGLFVEGKNMTGLKSAAITALGLCLLLKTNGLWPAFLASSIAIGSKFIIRVNAKHVFNPANIGIIAAIILTPDAWISPGQWGTNSILIFLFSASGLMILLKVGRLDTSLPFLITLFILEYSRSVLYMGWGVDVVLHKMTNGTILLFAFFMITDPVTTPNSPGARIFWSILIAIISFFIAGFQFIHTAPIWTLFLISPVTIILDKIYKHSTFKWINS